MVRSHNSDVVEAKLNLHSLAPEPTFLKQSCTASQKKRAVLVNQWIDYFCLVKNWRKLSENIGICVGPRRIYTSWICRSIRDGIPSAQSLGDEKLWGMEQAFYPILLWVFIKECSIFQRMPLTLTCLGSSKLVIGIPVYLVRKRIQNIIKDSLLHPRHPLSPPIIHLKSSPFPSSLFPLSLTQFKPCESHLLGEVASCFKSPSSASKPSI